MSKVPSKQIHLGKRVVSMFSGVVALKLAYLIARTRPCHKHKTRRKPRQSAGRDSSI